MWQFVSCFYNANAIATWHLTARIVESDETSTTRQQLGKHIPMVHAKAI